eukprot:2220077-Prymnesium_polylepis.1
MRSGKYLRLFSARCAATRNTQHARRQTRDGRRNSIMHPPAQPDHAADTTRPTQPTLPHKACEEREVCAPRSSSCTFMLVVVEAAGSVAGVIGDMVRLRSA